MAKRKREPDAGTGSQEDATAAASPTSATSVLEVPLRCPSCSGVLRSVCTTIGTQPIAGVLPSGAQYREIVRKSVQCDTCPQRYTLTVYEP